jgi:hypothetical protein
MTTRTEMLEASDLIDYRITEVLYSWTKNEGNNLEGFINNPSEHVNYSPYMIMDFSKLTQRLNMLRGIESSLVVITEYKKNNPDYIRSMYEEALDNVNVQLMQRLLDWLIKRYGDMTEMIKSNKAVDSMSPIHDYIGMFTFNQPKFLSEYTMYAKAIEGCKVVVDYKLGLTQEIPTEQLLTSNEPPQGA